MKTAISILKADALAKSLEISRSELYTKTLTNHVAEHDSASVTERLNAVYGDQTSEIDPLLEKMLLRSLKKRI
jgi:hypothetical protein